MYVRINFVLLGLCPKFTCLIYSELICLSNKTSWKKWSGTGVLAGNDYFMIISARFFSDLQTWSFESS
jgi:hypothetical protein